MEGLLNNGWILSSDRPAPRGILVLLLVGPNARPFPGYIEKFYGPFFAWKLTGIGKHQLEPPEIESLYSLWKDITDEPNLKKRSDAGNLPAVSTKRNVSKSKGGSSNRKRR